VNLIRIKSFSKRFSYPVQLVKRSGENIMGCCGSCGGEEKDREQEIPKQEEEE